MIYVVGAAMALIAGYRGLRIVEALSLIAVPFLFNLLVVLAADWHMAEIGAFVTATLRCPFRPRLQSGGR